MKRGGSFFGLVYHFFYGLERCFLFTILMEKKTVLKTSFSSDYEKFIRISEFIRIEQVSPAFQTTDPQTKSCLLLPTFVLKLPVLKRLCK